MSVNDRVQIQGWHHSKAALEDQIHHTCPVRLSRLERSPFCRVAKGHSPIYPKIHGAQVKWLRPGQTTGEALHDSRVMVGTAGNSQTVPFDNAFCLTF